MLFFMDPCHGSLRSFEVRMWKFGYCIICKKKTQDIFKDFDNFSDIQIKRIKFFFHFLEKVEKNRKLKIRKNGKKILENGKVNSINYAHESTWTWLVLCNCRKNLFESCQEVELTQNPERF